MEVSSYKNNLVKVTGKIEGELTLSHNVRGKKFYTTFLSVERLSGTIDTLPIVISEELLKNRNISSGDVFSAIGEYRSYNDHKGGKTHLNLYIYAMEIMQIGEAEINENEIILNGFICKPPAYRETPLGKEITDLLLAVNRPRGKSDYIPCICWGKNAKLMARADVGEQLVIHGRVQSRSYIKRLDGRE